MGLGGYRHLWRLCSGGEAGRAHIVTEFARQDLVAAFGAGSQALTTTRLARMIGAVQTGRAEVRLAPRAAIQAFMTACLAALTAIADTFPAVIPAAFLAIGKVVACYPSTAFGAILIAPFLQA